jgi:anaerobic selenocysteine-containing dehydrogenase
MRLLAVLTLMAVLATGGVLASAGAAVAPVARATVIVRAPVTSATARVGDEVRVELTACAASCGYTWRVSAGPRAAVAKYVSTTYRQSAGSKGLVGGNQIERVTFLAVGKGSTSIVFRYFPPGKGRAPTKRYRVTLRVA